MSSNYNHLYKENIMSSEDVKAQIKDMISDFIKDDPESAKQNFHAALASKMQDRINPVEEVETTEIDPEDETTGETEE